MEAIILAGGFGTRLRELVSDVPKPMAKVAGTPFLEILLRHLAYKGFTKIIISLGFMGEKISNYFGATYAGMNIIYVREKEPLGTGGAIRLAMTCSTADHIYIFNGDSFVDLEIDQLEALWSTYRQPVIVAREVSDIERYGQIQHSDGFVTKFSEKGKHGPGLINAGCYLLNREQLKHFPVGKFFSIESEYFTDAVKAEKFRVFITQGMFIDIGIPADYLRAQIDLINR